MRHIHLPEIESTQTHLKDWLKENPEEKDAVLVTTEKQSAGVGRYGNTWVARKENLAFSFCLKPAPELTLTALEMGVLFCNFSKDKWESDLKLKWPNDILNTDGKKCGGILLNLINPEQIIVGVGINLSGTEPFPAGDYNFEPGVVNSELIFQTEFYSQIPHEFAEYVLKNRLKNETIRTRWNELCAHKDIDIEIKDQNQVIEGRFIGIGPIGEAMLEIDGEEEGILTGSLSF